MQDFSWKSKRNELVYWIKKLSDEHGGDDIEELREYCQDVVKNHKDDLDKAIFCFKSLCTSPPKKWNSDGLNLVKSNVCDKCGYVPPFCYAVKNNICSNESKDVLHETIQRVSIGENPMEKQK